MASQSAELMNTYKVGLRVPKSLLHEQNELGIELEVLNSLRKQINGKPSKLVSGKLSKSSIEVKQKYQQVKEKYKYVRTLKQANLELARLRSAIKQLHWKNPILNSHQFSRTDVPSFQKNDLPQVNEISLTDYQNLASKSFKMLCKHLNEQVITEIPKVPRVKQDLFDLAYQNSQREGRKYTLKSIQSRVEIALANITGVHSNLGRTAFYQLGMTMKTYFDLRTKVEFIRQLLDQALPSNVDFSGEVPVLLAFYSLPNNLRNYITNSWGVDSQWIRNTVVGWRRKIDPLLPVPFQIEPLTEIGTQIAESFIKHARNEEDIQVISRLQGKQVLHLLPNLKVDLGPLLPPALLPNYQFLRNQINQVSRNITPHIHSISLKEFHQAAVELIQDVQKTQAQFTVASQSHKNCQTFINKITHIIKEANNQEVQEILLNYVLGNRFTSNVVKLLSKRSRYTRLFTAMRGIIALTLAKKHPSAIGQFLSALTPDNCLTVPFTSQNRDKSHLPVNLLFNKYIVERKAHPSSQYHLSNRHDPRHPRSQLENATELFRNNTPIWLGLPIYSPHQESQFIELLRGQRTTVRRKGLFWFQVFPSKKIVECIRQGAEIRDIRLNNPKGPTNKIVADIILSSIEGSAFQHRGKFLKMWDKEFGTPHLAVHEFLGSDFNRIGEYIVATSTPDSEHDLSEVMKRYKVTYDKLEKYRKWEIPHVQVQISTGRDKLGNQISAKKKGRLETQVTLLHHRRKNLMIEMKRQALMVYLYVAWRTKAKYLAWDSIGGISPRGQRGALAQAITYLPKRKGLYDELKQWAEDLKYQGRLPHYEETIPVSPFNSQVCAPCFQRTGVQERTRVKGIPYNEFLCNTCGWSTQIEPKSNRHSNSARVSALLLQKHVHYNHAALS